VLVLWRANLIGIKMCVSRRGSVPDNLPDIAVAPAKALMVTCPMPAPSVNEYLAALPADRRDALNEVRRGINRALPPGYKEDIQFGMVSWFVPLESAKLSQTRCP
jgi:hypothetical protein